MKLTTNQRWVKRQHQETRVKDNKNNLKDRRREKKEIKDKGIGRGRHGEDKAKGRGSEDIRATEIAEGWRHGRRKYRGREERREEKGRGRKTEEKDNGRKYTCKEDSSCR